MWAAGERLWYIVRLTDEERKLCDETLTIGSSQKARRARILRQVDANGPNWTDRAGGCVPLLTVENTRRRCVLEGFAKALHGQQRPASAVSKRLDGEQEAQLIALRLARRRRATWRGGGRIVELSHETARQTLTAEISWSTG